MHFDTIERLNRDQLVTATDRLLLHRSRLAREIVRLRRDSSPTVVVRSVAKRSTKRRSMLAAVVAFACAVVTLSLVSSIEATSAGHAACERSEQVPYAAYQL